MYYSSILTVLAWLVASNVFGNPMHNDYSDEIARYSVVWDTPSSNSSGSMPIGNGDIGLNVWVEESGDILFYIGKTDAWSENCRLLKLGRVRIKLIPNPFEKGKYFRQTLKLRQGEIEVLGGAGERRIKALIWVDANRPVVRIEIEGSQPFGAEVHLETWRNVRRRLEGDELHSAYGLDGDNPEPVFVEPDSVMDSLTDRIVWYHRNERSCYPATLEFQGIGSLVSKYPDPLLNRTFGGCIRGSGLSAVDSRTLVSGKPSQRFQISVYPLTARTNTAEEWLELLGRSIAAADSADIPKAHAEHRMWWLNFWSRSWIRVYGNDAAEAVTRGYLLQNWINACGGRGACPIKFNGSIFTVDAKPDSIRYDADYRRWGGPYWFQNTRLPYWSMPAAGNYDLMKPLFAMYRDALPLARERTRIYYGHRGAYFPETMYFWGTYVNSNYGWDRTGLPPGTTLNRYIRYEWQGGIELTAMMLAYYEHTQDSRFLRSELLPFADEILTFYDRHYPRDEKGRIRFEPAQALETYWDSVNPMPEIAGLTNVLSSLLELPDSLAAAEQRAMWRRMKDELPPIPIRNADGAAVLAAAEVMGPKSNVENPELYAIFPYRLFGVGKENIGLAQRTFDIRIHKSTGGWQQDAIQAALLGNAEEAARMVTSNFTTKNPESRFPAFWGPNFDWLPDQDHGSVGMIALQQMLMQADGRTILLLPAWPEAWNADFKLHAPYRTTVEGTVRNGKLETLKVTPEERSSDVIVMKAK